MDPRLCGTVQSCLKLEEGVAAPAGRTVGPWAGLLFCGPSIPAVQKSAHTASTGTRGDSPTFYERLTYGDTDHNLRHN
eukprot:scaffold11625_cov53-Phaeocystis_antarctica.AAC.1